MEHIRATLESVIGNIAKQAPEAEQAFTLFQKSLSKEECRHVQCNALRKGVLTVNVDSSAWLYQLNLKKEVLLHRLGIKDIRFRIGEIK